MRLNRRAVTALLLASLARPALAAPVRVKVPNRGFALPDWLAAVPREPAPAVLDRLRSLGFETIRLPIDPGFVSPATAGRIADVLATATGHGFNAILDLHPGPDATPGSIADAWTILADIVAATDPAYVYPELLNEPRFEPRDWTALRDRLAGIVRRRCPDHTLIWGPARYQGIWELDSSPPLADPNSIVALHYYTPMGFTHQGANWDNSPLARLHDLPFPATRDSSAVATLAANLDATDRQYLDGEFAAPWTIARIDEDFAMLARWSAANRQPVVLGEFGVLNFSADPQSRANWIGAVRRAAEAAGAGWTYWEADQGFGFMRDRMSTTGFDSTVIEALLA